MIYRKNLYHFSDLTTHRQVISLKKDFQDYSENIYIFKNMLFPSPPAVFNVSAALCCLTSGRIYLIIILITGMLVNQTNWLWR